MYMYVIVLVCYVHHAFRLTHAFRGNFVPLTATAVEPLPAAPVLETMSLKTGDHETYAVRPPLSLQPSLLDHWGRQAVANCRKRQNVH